MIADRDGIEFDGHIYNLGDTIPDLGSLVGTGHGEKHFGLTRACMQIKTNFLITTIW